jgi:Domain of unknown function (DUF3597)
MSLFSKILSKLGLGKDKPAAAATTAAKPVAPAMAAKPVTPATTFKPAAPIAKPKPMTDIAKDERDDMAMHGPAKQAAPAPTPISEVDVVKQLEQLSVGKGLDWKVSIVDLLKLLDIDSSFAARKELAVELGCPAELMNDSAKMNVWLHKTVLKKIAENGGNVPANLLD